MQIAQEKMDALHGLASSLGYSDQMTSLRVPGLGWEQVKVADIVAFARPHPEPQDQTTSAILGDASEKGDGNAIAMATALAAPAAAIPADREKSGRSMRRGHEKLPPAGSYGDASSPPSSLARELGPLVSHCCKGGLIGAAPFPTDVGSLLQEARRSSASRLISLSGEHGFLSCLWESTSDSPRKACRGVPRFKVAYQCDGCPDGQRQGLG